MTLKISREDSGYLCEVTDSDEPNVVVCNGKDIKDVIKISGSSGFEIDEEIQAQIDKMEVGEIIELPISNFIPDTNVNEEDVSSSENILNTDDKTSYQQWLQAGNEGTEEDFIKTLIPKTTYQVRFDRGNIESQEDFLTSLETVNNDDTTLAVVVLDTITSEFISPFVIRVEHTENEIHNVSIHDFSGQFVEGGNGNLDNMLSFLDKKKAGLSEEDKKIARAIKLGRSHTFGPFDFDINITTL